MTLEPPSDPIVSGLSHSPTIATIAEALALAQGEMTGAKKDGLNPHFRSKYADLAAIVGAIREPLSKNKIAHVQSPGNDSNGPFVDTLLLHASGEWIRGRIHMTPIKNDPQGIGSVITYMRRYSLQSLCGIEADDDDGNHATHGGNQPDAKPKLQGRTSPLPPGSFQKAKIVETPTLTTKTPPRSIPEPKYADRTGSDGRPDEVPPAFEEAPMITDWKYIPYESKGKSKKLGELSESFRADLLKIFTAKSPIRKDYKLVHAALLMEQAEKGSATSALDALVSKAKSEKVDIDILLIVAQKKINSKASNFFDIEEPIASQMLESWEQTLEYVKFEADQIP